MKEITKVFNSALSDLQTINWSETDGSDIRKILKSTFKPFMNHKPEIVKMFDASSEINKFQKMMIKDMLSKM